MDRVAHVLVDRARAVIGLTVAITLVCATVALWRMSFNADITAFLSESSDAGRAFAALQEKYAAGDPVTVLVERTDGGTMADRTGLELLLATRDALQAVPGVATVGTALPPKNPYTNGPFDKRSLDNLPDALFGVVTEGPASALLFSPDKRATLVVVGLEGDMLEGAEAVQGAGLPDGVRATFAGNPIVFATVIEMLGWFLLALPPSVILLLLLVFFINIGSRKLAALAIVPSVIGSVWTFGLIFALGLQVDIVTVIVPIWVIVMGSADGLHFVTHLQAARAHTEDRREQIAWTLRHVGPPMVLTTISTAAGFLSFLTTGVKPMEQLGLFAACGITFAGIASLVFLPAVLSRIEIEPPHAHAIGGRLVRLLQGSVRTRLPALVVAGLCIGFAGVYVPKLEVNPDQLFFFKDNHPVRAAFDKMSEVFGGATPMFGEMAFDPSGDVDAQLARIRDVERGLEQLPGVRRVFSLADVAETASPDMVNSMIKGEVESPMGKMVSDDGLRFVVFPRTFTSEDMQGWLAYVDEHAEIRVLTGTPVLFDAMSRLVLRGQATSLGAAFLFVALLLGIAYRRLWQTIIALVPISLTIAVVLGFLAASGIQLNLLTAVVSSIVIGIGIDYGIHLLAAIETARDGTPGYALRGLGSAGRAIIANALGVAVGMTALFLSPLRPHGQIAMLMWVSMVVGALTTLLILPALLPRDAVQGDAGETV